MSVSATKVQPDASVGPIIRLVDVDKWFGEFHVLKGINPCHPSVWYEGLLTRRVGV